MPRVARCPNCSAPLDVDLENPVVRCQYCGCDVKQTIALQAPPKPEPPRPRNRPQPPPAVIAPPARRASGALRFWIRSGIAIGLLAALAPLLWGTGLLSSLQGIWRSVSRQVTAGSRSAGQQGLAGAPASETEADSRLGDKLAVYSACLQSGSRAQWARERYLSWQPNRAGPTCRERYIGWGVPTLNLDRGSGGCGQRVGEVDARPPRLPALEEAAHAYVTELQELDDVLGTANRYYDQKDYKDDGCAKGKKLHQQMMDGFGRLDRAGAALRNGLEQELPPLLERRLHRAAAEEKGGALHAYLKLLLDGRQLFLALRARLLRAGTADDDALRALLQTVDTDIAEADAADKRQPRHTPIGIHAFDTWAKRYSLEYLKLGKEIVRQKAQVVGRRPGRARRQGIAGLVARYNDFLQHLRAPLPPEPVPSAAEASPPAAEAAPRPPAAVPRSKLKRGTKKGAQEVEQPLVRPDQPARRAPRKPASDEDGDPLAPTLPPFED